MASARGRSRWNFVSSDPAAPTDLWCIRPNLGCILPGAGRAPRVWPRPKPCLGGTNMQQITRRATLALGAASLAASARAIPRAENPPPAQPIEQGAALRVIRPARFIDADETIFRENASRFSEHYNVPVRVDFVGWEDIRPQTAVIANTGSGPDVVIGWGDDPHVYA